MKNKILSVVIPMYNVEKFIGKCLDSLIVPKNQFELLDIVVVNDGTPDNSAEIAKRYSEKYPNVIRVIDQENKGHGGAWNTGINEAIGKYIFFLDSDDWFDTEQFSAFIDKLINTDTDLVFVNSQTYYAENGTYSQSRIINMVPDKIYDANKYDWLHTEHTPNQTYIVHCIIKSELLKPHLPIFLEKVRYDDIILEGLPILIANSFVYYDLCIYNYYKGRAGQSYDPKIRAKHFDDVTTVVKSTIEFTKKNTPQEPSTRRDFGLDLYRSLIVYHYDEISREPKEYAENALCDWDLYVTTNHPDVQITRLVKLYRCLPFNLYISWYKIYRFKNRSIRWIKRHIKKWM